MPKAFILVGISASGKTSWAKEYAKKHKAIISNRDDMRFSLTGNSGWGDYKFDKKIEDTISRMQRDAAKYAAELGKDFILADTNLDRERRAQWVGGLKNLGFEVEIKDFPITLEEAWKRDALRGNGVGRDVIYKQWQQWLQYTGRRTYTPDPTKTKAVIFDIDGTLAHMGDRKPYDWTRVGEDKVDPVVQMIFDTFAHTDHAMIIVSGRDGVCERETIDWLHDNRLYWDCFAMRAEGDQRKDTVIKEEIFWRDIAPNYNVVAVVDDRPCVVRMWHDIGIPKVIAVGNQCVEF